MARKDEKPMLPAAPERPSWFVPCAGNSSCRFPGRMFVEGLGPKERLCVNHFYDAIDRGAKEAEPPRKMLGVVPKAVAGPD